MSYQAQDFQALIGLPGFSDQLLTNHFTLYQGYVTNTNKVSDELAQLASDGQTATPHFAELKRRFGWEWNGVRLHELYFSNLTKTPAPLDTNSNLGQKIIAQFGSIENWQAQFKATGTIRGIGWVILYYDESTDTLTNTWINEHDGGHLAGAKPLLIMDVFEHAFMVDYGLKRADYLDAFMAAINWQAVSNRL
ncbi:MAG: Fe-Mn family superoxide dismutase [Candidatus Falkowbacteria bacterium]